MISDWGLGKLFLVLNKGDWVLVISDWGLGKLFPVLNQHSPTTFELKEEINNRQSLQILDDRVNSN